MAEMAMMPQSELWAQAERAAFQFGQLVAVMQADKRAYTPGERVLLQDWAVTLDAMRDTARGRLKRAIAAATRPLPTLTEAPPAERAGSGGNGEFTFANHDGAPADPSAEEWRP